MNRQIINWTLRLTVTGLLVAGLLLVIVLNPILTYASRTTHDHFTIYHNEQLDPTFTAKLDEAAALVQGSEFYDPGLRLDICLNDGRVYPGIMVALQGPAFAWGFYDKVVLHGTTDHRAGCVELNGYPWNLTQLLAHEMVHCVQFDKLGFWGSAPVANIPEWKWEGYAEYIARQNDDQRDLARNIARLVSTDAGSWAVEFGDGTVSSRAYYEYWTMVQYCMDIKSMSYEQVLADTTAEQVIEQEMMQWYEHGVGSVPLGE